MKKKFLYGLAVLFIAVVAAFNVNLNSNGDGLSDVSLANVEALANMSPGCPNGCVKGLGGCYCNGPYPQFKEYDWGD